MAEIFDLNRRTEENSLTETFDAETLNAITSDLLLDTRNSIDGKAGMSIPIAGLAGLGASVASMLPAFRTVTQTSIMPGDGLYRLANQAIGDTLKAAKDGKFWGAMKTAEGGSKMAKFVEAGAQKIQTKTINPIDPTTVMMAVALYSIEKELGKIADMERQILNFLEVEKESKIEADVQTLSKIVSNYKMNWDNEHYIASNHKLVLDIERSAREHMNTYQKDVSAIIDAKQYITAQAKIKSTTSELLKKFKYYRLSLYTFSLASFMEIMLSGNFNEEYITSNKDEIETLTKGYTDAFSNCSDYLLKMGKVSVETNVLKGIGIASKAVGKFIGKIPKVRDGQVDEFLQGSGEHLNENAAGLEKSAAEEFAAIKDPETQVFRDKLDDMIQIYSHTTDIAFDKDNIYLIA